MKFIQICSIALALVLPGAAFASDIARLTVMCDGCHGPQGASSNSDVPTIGGQTREFMEDTLRSFQMWGRPCIKSLYRHGDTSRPQTDMCQIADELSDEDITALGSHYSEQPFVAATQEFDAAQVAAGAALHEEHCESCHEQGGTSVAGRAPRIAGQWVTYMKSTLKYVPTGEHRVPRMMERGLDKFGAEELDALMSFYASQQNQDQPVKPQD